MIARAQGWGGNPGSWDQAEGTESCEFGFGVKKGIQQQVRYLEDLEERSSKECRMRSWLQIPVFIPLFHKL